MKSLIVFAVIVTSITLAQDSAAGSKKPAADTNACGATVSLVNVYQDADGRHWHFLFDIVEANASDTATSTGTFNYDYVYIDGNNMPHSVQGLQGPGWHPADGHEHRPVDTRDQPDAVSIDSSSITIHDVFSTDCSSQALKQKK